MPSSLLRVVQSHVNPLLKSNGFGGRGAVLYRDAGELKYAVAWQSCAKLVEPGQAEAALSVEACVGSFAWAEMLQMPIDNFHWSLFQMRMSVAEMAGCPSQFIRNATNVIFLHDEEEARIIGNLLCGALSEKVLPVLDNITTTDSLIAMLLSNPRWRYVSDLRLEYDIAVWRGQINPENMPFLKYWQAHDPEGYPEHLFDQRRKR